MRAPFLFHKQFGLINPQTIRHLRYVRVHNTYTLLSTKNVGEKDRCAILCSTFV